MLATATRAGPRERVDASCSSHGSILRKPRDLVFFHGAFNTFVGEGEQLFDAKLSQLIAIQLRHSIGWQPQNEVRQFSLQ